VSIKGERVTVTSGYGANTKRPFVAVQIGDRKPMQWSPDEARRVAALLLECADAAEGDAFLVSFALEKLGTDMQRAGMLLHEFRQWRERHREGGQV